MIPYHKSSINSRKDWWVNLFLLLSFFINFFYYLSFFIKFHGTILPHTSHRRRAIAMRALKAPCAVPVSGEEKRGSHPMPSTIGNEGKPDARTLCPMVLDGTITEHKNINFFCGVNDIRYFTRLWMNKTNPFGTSTRLIAMFSGSWDAWLGCAL